MPVSDIRNVSLTFAECRRPWVRWGLPQHLGNVSSEWGKCSPSDIDGVLEINKHVLFIEDKDFGTEDQLATKQDFVNQISRGQALLFNTLCIADNQSVLVIDGPRDRPRSAVSWRTGTVESFTGTDAERQRQLVAFIVLWAEHVLSKIVMTK